MELLRIIAMFMILVIHANMIALQRPTSAELFSNSLATVTRYFIESFGIVGVNIFVMLSGWFLIKSRPKSFLSLFFQVLYFWGGGFLLFFLIGMSDFTSENVLEVFAFTKRDWFIKAYIVLMIIAPILNVFIQNSSEKLQRLVLIGFFLFSTFYGWMGGANRFFVDGYGPLLFVGLYLLSQYAHHAQMKTPPPPLIYRLLRFDRKYDFMVFCGCVIINTLIGILGLYYRKNIYGMVYAYTNPITIIAALYLLLFFSKIEMRNNRIVNILATGSFAVYLFHSQINIRPYFNKSVQYLYSLFDGVSCVAVVFVFLAFVYVISVAIDLPRLWMWNKLSKKFNIR